MYILKNGQKSKKFFDSQGKVINSLAIFSCYGLSFFRKRHMRKNQLLNALRIILKLNDLTINEIAPDHLYMSKVFEIEYT